MNLNIRWKEIKNDANTQNVLLTISDIIKFYKRGRLNINPSYQRSYRWTNEQKGKFIESILLKYPIPPIIAIQTETEDGLPNLEIIDGVQRISAILEFVADDIPEVKKVHNVNEKMKGIIGADIFKELNGQTWNDFKEKDFDFTFEASNLLFMNFTSDKEIIKYDVFERLNTLSTQLSPQEVRNSILALKNKDIYIKVAEDVYNHSEIFIGKANMAKRQDMEFFLEFSLIKNQEIYLEQIEEEVKNSLKTKTKDKGKHFDLLLSTYAKLLNIEDLNSDLEEYKEFLTLNRDLWFKKYDTEKNITSGIPIKFFFEVLSFIYFSDKKHMINKDFYQTYFSENYHDILKDTLGKNNPNARDRFEVAKKIVEGFDGNELYSL